MGAFIGILVVGAIVGGVVWNRRNAAAAMAGVQFVVPASPAEVTSAIHAAYNLGASGAFKSMTRGMRVASAGSGFAFESKIGDSGIIQIRPDGAGTTVRAATEQLFVGSHPKTHSRGSGLWALSSALTHGIYRLIGVTPGAAKMKKFQESLERTIAKQMQKAARKAARGK